MTTSPWTVNLSCRHKCLLSWPGVTLGLRKCAHQQPTVLGSTMQTLLLLCLHAITELHTIQVLFIISAFELSRVTEEHSQSPKSNQAVFRMLHAD